MPRRAQRARWALALAVVATLAAVVGAQVASASQFMRVGIYDEAQTLYGPIPQTFALLGQLHVQEIRENLYWGGPYGVAQRKPAKPADPEDPAYNWSLYDRTVQYASAYGIHVLFSVYATPSWESGLLAKNIAPRNPRDLQLFAYAAAKRYDGTHVDKNNAAIPAVKEWAAWNEPNNPVFLTPQFTRAANGKWLTASALAYAKICNAIYTGVHATLLAGERVACGETAPRGNNDPTSDRPSVAPLAFLKAVKKDGLVTFDAWSHHPYYSAPSDQPDTKPVTASGATSGAVSLGNLSDLTKLVTTLYGSKRIWITEYGYQTNPPDTLFGVTYARQAAYLRQAFGIARANPRVDMMLWFLLKDDPDPNGWQLGLISVSGKKKPAFAAFATLPH